MLAHTESRVMEMDEEEQLRERRRMNESLLETKLTFKREVKMKM